MAHCPVALVWAACPILNLIFAFGREIMGAGCLGCFVKQLGIIDCLCGLFGFEDYLCSLGGLGLVGLGFEIVVVQAFYRQQWYSTITPNSSTNYHPNCYFIIQISKYCFPVKLNILCCIVVTGLVVIIGDRSSWLQEEGEFVCWVLVLAAFAMIIIQRYNIDL